MEKFLCFAFKKYVIGDNKNELPLHKTEYLNF